MIPAITWLPSPFKNARVTRWPILGVVSHRIVGTLSGARGAFGVAPGTPRNVSSHFGIGYISGRLTIDQYVDLSDMAWTNGDVRDPTWAYYQDGVNPNLTTVTIEHEDGGSANRGRVSEEVWQTSMELQKLITSGNPAAIRGAGIRVRSDATIAQLASVSKDVRGFIDHHQIAGPNKPYCFRRWLDDPGFVEGNPSRRDRLIAHLTEADVPIFTRPVREQWTMKAGSTFWTGGPEMGESKTYNLSDKLWSNGETTDGVWRRFEFGAEELWFKRADITPVSGTRNPTSGYGNPTLSTGHTDAELAAAKASGVTAGKADMKAKAIVAGENHVTVLRALK